MESVEDCRMRTHMNLVIGKLSKGDSLSNVNGPGDVVTD